MQRGQQLEYRRNKCLKRKQKCKRKEEGKKRQVFERVAKRRCQRSAVARPLVAPSSLKGRVLCQLDIVDADVDVGDDVPVKRSMKRNVAFADTSPLSLSHVTQSLSLTKPHQQRLHLPPSLFFVCLFLPLDPSF